ncbi:MAG: hypothetical protein MZW92_49675 [Comamonadaceae bacterium]|nr:hypothetical protein [Comamonadaceae bacterium]
MWARARPDPHARSAQRLRAARRRGAEHRPRPGGRRHLRSPRDSRMASGRKPAAGASVGAGERRINWAKLASGLMLAVALLVAAGIAFYPYQRHLPRIEQRTRCRHRAAGPHPKRAFVLAAEPQSHAGECHHRHGRPDRRRQPRRRARSAFPLRRTIRGADPAGRAQRDCGARAAGGSPTGSRAPAPAG